MGLALGQLARRPGQGPSARQGRAWRLGSGGRGGRDDGAGRGRRGGDAGRGGRGPGGADGGRASSRGGRPGGRRDAAPRSSSGSSARACCRRSPSSSAAPAARRPSGQLLASGMRLITEVRGRAQPPPRRGAHPGARRRGPVGARLLGLRRRHLARVRRAPRRHAADVPRDRRGALHRRPDPGRLRHRDAGPRHQHAGAHRRAREAREVQRREPRRHLARPSTPSSPAGPVGEASTSRATPWCCGTAGSTPLGVAGLASTRTYPLRSSFRPTYNMAVNLVRQFGRESAREILETSFAQFQADRAVVGFVRTVRRNEEALAGYDEQMTLPPRRLHASTPRSATRSATSRRTGRERGRRRCVPRRRSRWSR